MSSIIVSPHDHVSDELGALIYVALTSFNHSPSWDAFVSKSLYSCDIASGVQHLNHPAATLLLGTGSSIRGVS
jgi:hypothetical protein